MAYLPYRGAAYQPGGLGHPGQPVRAADDAGIADGVSEYRHRHWRHDYTDHRQRL